MLRLLTAASPERASACSFTSASAVAAGSPFGPRRKCQPARTSFTLESCRNRRPALPAGRLAARSNRLPSRRSMRPATWALTRVSKLGLRRSVVTTPSSLKARRMLPGGRSAGHGGAVPELEAELQPEHLVGVGEYSPKGVQALGAHARGVQDASWSRRSCRLRHLSATLPAYAARNRAPPFPARHR